MRVQEIVSYEMKTGNKMTMKESINSYWMRTEKEIVNKKYIDQNELQATPVVLSGSNVISGSGKMIALCIGKYSRRG